MTKVLGMIPARLNSSRFPGKPLALLLGKPMIEHTYKAVCRSNYIDKVIVTSDSMNILQVVQNLGGEVVLTGPCATGTDRIVQAIREMEAKNELKEYDIIVNIQGDEPAVNPKHIDACVTALIDNWKCPKTVMSTIATPITNEDEARDVNTVKCVVDQYGNGLYFSRAMIPHSKRGVYEPDIYTYRRHIGLYAFKRQFLMQFPSLPASPLEEVEDLEQLRVLSAGYKIQVVDVDHCHPGVDTLQDLEVLAKELSTISTP